MKSLVAKFLVGVLAFSVVPGIASGTENLIKNNDASKKTEEWKGITGVVDGGKSGQCFEVKNSKVVMSRQMIPIDPKATYRLTAWFKSGSDKKNKVYFGLVFYDKNRCRIWPESIMPIEASETVLVKEAKKGTKMVYVKDVTAWMPALKKKRAMIAFEVDDTGAYSDLPNFKVIPVVRVKVVEGGHQVFLKTPLSKDMPANTKVRCHTASGHNMYISSFKKNLKEWTRIGGDINPEVKKDAPHKTIWRGTQFVDVLILANWQQKSGEILLIDDIALTKKIAKAGVESK